MDERILENGKKLPKLRTFSVKFDAETALQLNRVAAKSGRSVDFVIRGIVLTFLEDHPLPSDQEVPGNE